MMIGRLLFVTFNSISKYSDRIGDNKIADEKNFYPKCAEAFLHTRFLTRNDIIGKRVFYAKICSVQLYEQCEAADDVDR
jgi:hypothetical protein